MPVIKRPDLSKAGKILNDDLITVYSDALGLVVAGTPADKGRARNNWFLTEGRPFGLMSSREPNEKGSGSLANINSGMPDNVIGKKLYFTNNLPYITTLEYGGYPDPVEKGSYDKATDSYVKLSQGGFSRQAPGGFVRKVLQAAARKIKSL